MVASSYSSPVDRVQRSVHLVSFRQRTPEAAQPAADTDTPTKGRRPKKPLRPEDHDRIRNLYREGLSIRKVATTTGASQWQVKQVLGSDLRTPRKAQTLRAYVAASVQRDIIGFREKGYTYVEIAEMVGSTRSIVERIVHESLADEVHDEVKHQISRRTRVDHSQIIHLSDQGLSKKKIAKELGCSQDTVARARREAGWKFKKKR